MSDAVSAVPASIPDAGWVVVTYYREMQGYLTPYEELRRSRVYRWRWLARLLSYSRASVCKVDGRYYFTYDAIVPAAALKGTQP